MIDVSLLLTAGADAAAFRAQVDSLVAAGLDDRVEVVIVEDGASAATRQLLAQLVGDVVVVPNEQALGRRRALALAAGTAQADVCVALSAVARPRPGFHRPLADAVRAGATLAAPLLETAGGVVAGYAVDAEDGALLPLAPGTGVRAEVAALDCLAAPRSFWRDRVPPLAVRDGFYETALASAAGAPAIVAEAHVERAPLGPPASVIVCTRDRVDETRTCVETLARHGVLAGGCEIVVVDNGSTDGTADAVRELQAQLGPGLTLVEEPIAGLSRARNAGAAAAAHEVLCYLDDDARPAPGWLEHLRGAFADPAIAIAGGPIHALWPPSCPPGWPPDGLEGFFSVLSFGDADQTNPQAWHYGANWAVRRGVLDAVGGFDLRLGASDDGRLGAEETAAGYRIAQLGLGASRYVAAAGVGHRIDPDRLDDGWLTMRAFKNGVENPHLAAGFREPEPARVAQQAAAAAAELVSRVPLAGVLDADDALARVANAPLPLHVRVEAARALGTVAEAVLLLGGRECVLGELTLVVRPEHGRGFVRRPVVDLPVAA